MYLKEMNVAVKPDGFTLSKKCKAQTHYLNNHDTLPKNRTDAHKQKTDERVDKNDS